MKFKRLKTKSQGKNALLGEVTILLSKPWLTGSFTCLISLWIINWWTLFQSRGTLFRSSPFLSTEAQWSFRQLFCSCLVLCSFKKISFKRKETDQCPLWDVAPAVTSWWTKVVPLSEPCLLHWPGLWLIYNIINNYYCSCMYWPFAMLHALCQVLIIHYFI